jgi:hypothetical protein
MIGTKIREQFVDHCELTVDTLGQPDPIRVFLTVIFRENPVPNVSPDDDLVKRIFSEIPPSATTEVLTTAEAIAIMGGDADPNTWWLADECRVSS